MTTRCEVVIDPQSWNQWADERSGGRSWHLIKQHRLICGYWVCGRPHGRATLMYGDYPHSFVDRVLALFRGLDAEERLLHAPSGILTRDGAVLRKYDHLGLTRTPGVTVDIACDSMDFEPVERPIIGAAGQRIAVNRQIVPRRPEIIASVDKLPFDDETFDVVLSDPPYTRPEEFAYNPRCPKYPLRGALAEALRVLRPGGYFAMLHTYTGPPRSNILWETCAVIGVASSTMLERTRTLSIIRKRY